MIFMLIKTQECYGFIEKGGKKREFLLLKKLEMESNLEYIFGIVVNVENNEKPAMYFNIKFIEFANHINAEFYIDLYVY